MRMLTIAAAALLAVPAIALAVPCDLPHVEYEWDFSLGTNGFTTEPCSPESTPTWAMGVDPMFEGLYLWGTSPGAFYPDNAGDRLLSPEFEVTPASNLVEVYQWYDIVPGDGGNLTVDGQSVVPVDGYPRDDIAGGCSDDRSGFGGQGDWGFACYDLSAFLGQTIQLSFNFASDHAGTSRGWYIALMRVGGEQVVPATTATWGAVKALYR